MVRLYFQCAQVQSVLTAVKEVPQPLPSRQALYDHLSSRGMSKTLQHWLGSSLVPVGPGHSGPLRWQFDVAGAQQLFDDYRRTEFSQLLR